MGQSPNHFILNVLLFSKNKLLFFTLNLWLLNAYRGRGVASKERLKLSASIFGFLPLGVNIAKEWQAEFYSAEGNTEKYIGDTVNKNIADMDVFEGGRDELDTVKAQPQPLQGKGDGPEGGNTKTGLREEKFTKMLVGVSVDGEVGFFIAGVQGIYRFVVRLNHLFLQVGIVLTIQHIKQTAGHFTKENSVAN